MPVGPSGVGPSADDGRWAVTSSPTAMYAVQTCGTDSTRSDGPATLIRFDPHLRATGSWPIGVCTGASDLGANSRDQVLLSAYLYCAGSDTQPASRLDRLDQGQLVTVTTVPGGVLAYQHLAW